MLHNNVDHCYAPLEYQENGVVVSWEGGEVMLPTYELQLRLGHEAIVELTQERDAALAEVERLLKLSDELYYSLRMADDAAVEESMFEADERSTGPDGLYIKLEEHRGVDEIQEFKRLYCSCGTREAS